MQRSKKLYLKLLLLSNDSVRYQYPYHLLITAASDFQLKILRISFVHCRCFNRAETLPEHIRHSLKTTIVSLTHKCTLIGLSSLVERSSTMNLTKQTSRESRMNMNYCGSLYLPINPN
jgi:hypothetical protein